MSKPQNYDSDFCGSLPLQHINVIQSYGYLIVLRRSDMRIIQVSENAAGIFNAPVDTVISSLLVDHILPDEHSALKDKFALDIREKIPLTLTFGNKRMLALVHLKQDYLLLELEHYNEEQERHFTAVFQEIRYAMAAIEHAETVEEVSKVAIHQLRKLSGFDGIMMYRFDEDWNGTVLAEEKSEGLEQYLGLTFPASDVPKQARALYLRNAYRLIPDRQYTPVKLYPVINPLTHTFTDLADCNLRGVAAVHLEYLKNMGVTASMSIRVIHNGQLWGLISCHHRTAKTLTFEVCSVFELLSSVISQKITSVLHQQHYNFATSLQHQSGELSAHIFTENDIAKGLTRDNGLQLLQLFNATGAALWLDDRLRTVGAVPDEHFLDDFYLWIQGKNIDKVTASEHFANLYQDAQSYTDIASGVMVIPINPLRGEYVAVFRPEAKRTINWGGDPNKAINFEADRKNYHPRNSFAMWQQTVNQTSLPWHKQEQEIAEGLRSYLYEFTTR
jgi:chemotaxis family two-component system sensor kinase Cph1